MIKDSSLGNRILIFADFRSAITLEWVDQLHNIDLDIVRVSSRSASETDFVAPITAEGLASIRGSMKSKIDSVESSLPSSASNLKTRLLRITRPSVLHFSIPKLKQILSKTKPDLIHALRIPYEGIAMSLAAHDIPFAMSVWGNDFTMHAQDSIWCAKRTRKSLERAAGLHTDVHRDLRLATQEWGFSSTKPTLVCPGSGGVDTKLFTLEGPNLRKDLGIETNATVFLNPRGIRSYACTHDFFEISKLILDRDKDAHVVCIGMKGSHVAEQAVSSLTPQAQTRIHLLPVLPHQEMPKAIRTGNIMFSLTTHDGTPNTVLESISCGLYPIVSNIASLSEWITDGVNGSLVSPEQHTSVASLAISISHSSDVMERARKYNASLIASKASKEANAHRIHHFYESMLTRQGN